MNQSIAKFLYLPCVQVLNLHRANLKILTTL